MRVGNQEGLIYEVRADFLEKMMVQPRSGR